MSPRSTSGRPLAFSLQSPSWSGRLLGALLVCAVVAAYRNTLSVPFFFDDHQAITDNETIRQLWPPGRALSPPPGGTGASGRPIVNLSLALNYAFGGLEVRGYHAVNVGLHACAGLLLFGIVRCTLQRPGLAERFGGAARPLGFLVAALWLLHPLQTESVTCIIQRTEVLFSIFYLLTLYAFIRHVEEPAGKAWAFLAVVACLLGMASKEAMVSAPLIVFLYDRTFVAGTFVAAWRERSKFHLALAASWLFLGYLVLSAGGTRGAAAGFGIGVSPWSYALKQCEAIVLYLKLALWPHPLVADYGVELIDRLGEVWWHGLGVLSLVGAVVFALARHPFIGFLGAWFLALLAPSSSFLPLVSQTMAEHRMYLPLAALAAGFVVALHAISPAASLRVALVIALGLGGLTVRRNEDYRSEINIWSDTVTKVPRNARARVNLGSALKHARRYDEAMAEFGIATSLKPTPEAMSNIGAIFLETGRPAEAIAPSRAALQINPNFALAHNNLGSALARLGQTSEAREHLVKALALKPTLAPAHSNLAGLLLFVGEFEPAQHHAREALRLQPDLWGAHENLGHALLRAGRPADAIGPLTEADRHLPASAHRASTLGAAVYQAGRPADAIPWFEAALRADPSYIDALNNLAGALFQTGRPQESVAAYRRALQLKPERADLHSNLGIVLSQIGQVPEAIAAYEQALRLQPDLAVARNNLAFLRAGGTPAASGRN